MDHRAKAHATELRENIARHIQQKGINGVETVVEPSTNNVILGRSTGSLEIDFREVEPGKWQYNVNQRHKNRLQNQLINNFGNKQLSEDQMEDAVLDFLK